MDVIAGLVFLTFKIIYYFRMNSESEQKKITWVKCENEYVTGL
jgi:hypothetical protein